MSQFLDYITRDSLVITKAKREDPHAEVDGASFSKIFHDLAEKPTSMDEVNA